MNETKNNGPQWDMLGALTVICAAIVAIVWIIFG